MRVEVLSSACSRQEGWACHRGLQEPRDSLALDAMVYIDRLIVRPFMLDTMSLRSDLNLYWAQTEMLNYKTLCIVYTKPELACYFQWQPALAWYWPRLNCASTGVIKLPVYFSSDLCIRLAPTHWLRVNHTLRKQWRFSDESPPIRRWSVRWGFVAVYFYWIIQIYL